MKRIYLLLIFFIPLISLAQVSVVKEEIEASSKHYKDALKEINLAIGKLEECDKTHSVEFIHRNASDAERYLSRAERILGYAKDKANNAKKEASGINCSVAEDASHTAENYFYDAKIKLSTTRKNLRQLRYNDDLGLLKNDMSDVKFDVQHTLKKMSDAINKLGETTEALNTCG